MSLRRGRGPRRDDEWCLVIPSSWEPALITTFLSRQPLTSVLRSITDPRDRRGVAYAPPTVLSLAVTVVTAICLSLTPIREHKHTTGLTAADLWSLGLAA